MIPARMASTRLPGKPLADIAGAPMIVHVWRASVAANVGPVYVAAAEQEIVDAVEQAGGKAVLTDPNLASGSDRVWAAAQIIDPNGEHDVIVNVQGDMPTMEPVVLERAVHALANSPEADIATIASLSHDPDELARESVVKAIVAAGEDGQAGRALYFTRAPAPSGEGPIWHHIGLYAFRRAALAKFTTLSPSPLEKRERLEQLRALEAGMRIDVALVESNPEGVDTPEDLQRARRLLGGG